MAPDTRISEDGNIIWMDPRHVFATKRMFDRANEALQGQSQMLLQPVEGRDFNLSLPEDENQMTELVVGEHFAVRPTYNPARMSPSDPRQTFGPSYGDDDETISKKHDAYMHMLLDFYATYRKFEQQVRDEPRRFPPVEETVIEANRWVIATPNGELIRTEIAVAFFDYKDHKDHQQLGRDLARLGEAIKGFIGREADNRAAIILPNDCAQCVSEIVGGAQARSRASDLGHSPEIGSNYYASLETPKHGSFGWNFHWAGVVMKGGSDNLTLETAAGLSMAAADKATWWFALYGTRHADQTFKKQVNLIHFQRNIEEAKRARSEAMAAGLKPSATTQDRQKVMEELGKQNENISLMRGQMAKVNSNNFDLAEPRPQPVVEEEEERSVEPQREPVDNGSALMQEMDEADLPDWVQK